MTERALEHERQRRARLANMRHELLAPVTALVGQRTADRESTRTRARRDRRGSSAHSDLGPRVARADRLAARGGRCGWPLIRRRFQRASGQVPARSAQPSECDQGLCRELLLEELDEVGAAATRPTWKRLPKRTVSLSRVDVIIDFLEQQTNRQAIRNWGGDPGGDRQSGPTVRPIEEVSTGPSETARIPWSTTMPAIATFYSAA